MFAGGGAKIIVTPLSQAARPRAVAEAAGRKPVTFSCRLYINLYSPRNGSIIYYIIIYCKSGAKSVVCDCIVTIAMSVSVSLSVRKRVSRNSKTSSYFSCTLPMSVVRPSSDPPLVALRYVIYFRFCERRHIYT